MSWSEDPRLLTYAFGEFDALTEEDRREIERALEDDAGAREALDELRSFLPEVEAAVAGAAQRDDAGGLGDIARHRITRAARGEGARESRRWMAVPLASAAAVTLAVTGAFLLSRDGGLVGNRAPESELAAEIATETAVAGSPDLAELKARKYAGRGEALVLDAPAEVESDALEDEGLVLDKELRALGYEAEAEAAAGEDAAAMDTAEERRALAENARGAPRPEGARAPVTGASSDGPVGKSVPAPGLASAGPSTPGPASPGPVSAKRRSGEPAAARGRTRAPDGAVSGGGVTDRAATTAERASLVVWKWAPPERTLDQFKQLDTDARAQKNVEGGTEGAETRARKEVRGTYDFATQKDQLAWHGLLPEFLVARDDDVDAVTVDTQVSPSPWEADTWLVRVVVSHPPGVDVRDVEVEWNEESVATSRPLAGTAVPLFEVTMKEGAGAVRGVATVRVRATREDGSALTVESVPAKAPAKRFEDAPSGLRHAASAAALGNRPKGASLDDVRRWAKEALGTEPKGRGAELLKAIEAAARVESR